MKRNGVEGRIRYNYGDLFKRTFRYHYIYGYE